MMGGLVAMMLLLGRTAEPFVEIGAMATVVGLFLFVPNILGRL